MEELTPMTRPEKMLRRVRLELARDHEFPDGSRERGYDFIAPLDANGHIDLPRLVIRSNPIEEECSAIRLLRIGCDTIGQRSGHGCR